MNIAKYKNLSKIIAAYLKLDFQSEVLMQLSNNRKTIHPSVFMCDEYHEYVTLSDSDFFAQSREAKCINIVATQSYTSILNTLKDESSVKVILQNLVNKLWLRTDDMFTIETAQKQVGREDKIRYLKNISENAAITKLFNSELYAILEQEDTKVWHYSTHMLYSLLEQEEKTGKIEFPDV